MYRDIREPRKAYWVERVTRGVTSALVYADDYADAQRRYLEGEYTNAHTEHEGRGFARVRRAPEEDRDA